MRKHLVVFSSFLVLAAGCSQSHVVQRSSAPVWSAEAAEDLTGESGDVRLAGGGVLRGEFHSVTADSVSMLTDGADPVRTVPLDSVVAMRSRLSVLAPIGGALLGGIVGGALGGLLGMKETVDEGPGMFLGFANGVAAGVVLGGTAGGVIVGISTMSHEYTLAPRTP